MNWSMVNGGASTLRESILRGKIKTYLGRRRLTEDAPAPEKPAFGLLLHLWKTFQHS
jgi:hypothetical protein